MRVLYVEDHPAQASVMKRVLEFSEYEVALACNGKEGIQKTYEWHPDIILMDLRIPGMNGFETIQKLKSDPAVSNIPIIAISAWTSRTNREKALEVGAAKFMAKPLDTRRLLYYIDRLADRCKQNCD